MLNKTELAYILFLVKTELESMEAGFAIGSIYDASILKSIVQKMEKNYA